MIFSDYLFIHIRILSCYNKQNSQFIFVLNENVIIKVSAIVKKQGGVSAEKKFLFLLDCLWLMLESETVLGVPKSY